MCAHRPLQEERAVSISRECKTPEPTVNFAEFGGHLHAVVNGVMWGASRTGGAVLLYTQVCRCQTCDACIVGKKIVERTK